MKKRAIVTGGNSGLGYAIAQELLALDLEVILTGRDDEKLIQAKTSLGSDSVSYAAFNVADESAIDNFFKNLDYPVTYLFNVAGVGVFGSIEEINRADIDRLLESNLIGLMLMTSGFIKKFGNEEIRIINVMSTAAQVGKKSEAMYCAAKWGARGFTEALKTTYKGSNISVLGVYPGGWIQPFGKTMAETCPLS
ncbi:SDR family NAD(P)-dependent oxidoreductase [Vibrio hannami]|uniref:SDR family NAD(P)-dependent oxidoreductase n=1 Tax=Vibrio hannami TaxID=2717094 RepID=UPI00240FF12A|nr:SDR family NAD(P)-dependent oxidoreductase [Vibrio hannami]MDG3088458.1 SDR family NAD(P)-dependent oxidoreductase [Vibrio hannami]